MTPEFSELQFTMRKSSGFTTHSDGSVTMMEDGVERPATIEEAERVRGAFGGLMPATEADADPLAHVAVTLNERGNMDVAVDLDENVHPSVRQYVVLAIIQHLIEKLQEIDGGGPA